MSAGGKRPGAGRPAGSGTGRRRVAVSISLQPAEREELAAMCQKLGISQSDFVRLAMRHSAVLAALAAETRDR